MRECKIFTFNSIKGDNIRFSDRELFESKLFELASKMKDSSSSYDGWIFSVYSDSIDYISIFEEAEKLGLKAEVTTYKTEYAKQDFKEAEYFLLTIGIFGKEDYTESYDTKYTEISKCEKCEKAIMRQDSELYIDKTLFRGKDIGTTINWEIVVSEKLRKIIEESNLTGIAFSDIRHKNNRLKNDFTVYQMKINNVMPQMDKSTSVYYDSTAYCDLCKTHGRLLTTLPKYKMKDMEHMKDFNYTSEYFGGGFLGYKNIVITRKVYDLFKNNKIKNVRYNIVQVI